MNAKLHTCIGQAGLIGRRARQHGGETVEFALLAFFFFLLLFAIIDMSLVMFNNAVVNQATRYSARQGTLYWVNPTGYNPLDPVGSICVRRQMIQSAIDFYQDNVLIATAAGFESQYDVVDAPESLNIDGWCEVSHSDVVVQLGYPHDYLILDGLLNLANVNLSADTGLFTESDL